MCQQKKKPNTRISLTRKVDHDRLQSANGWNEREFDDHSSNSNSLDGACIDENISSTKSSKSIKIDGDSSEMISTNRRKRNRALKVIVNEDAVQSDDEKSLNICWNADSDVKIKEENISPIDEVNMSDSGSNQTGDTDTLVKSIKSEATSLVKEEKRTRNSNTVKTSETKTKSKLSSCHCKYCGKKFSNASNLRRHITMSHFGPKKFTCNLCTFRARRKIDIIGHVRSTHQFGGERSEAFKFVTINDEPMPKPPPPSGVNRRKEKHTEVLRDDDEEIFIDSEPFIVDDRSEQATVPVTSNENSNIDMDDNLSNNIDEAVEQAETSKSATNSKRKGRPKTKDKLKNVARSISPIGETQKIDETLPTRRPIRNRIMPVKKDFVYDLSTLLKKDYKDFQDEFQKQTLSQPEPPQTQVTQTKSRNASPTPIENKTSKRRQVLPNESEHQSNADQPKEEPRKLPLQQPSPPPPAPQPQPQNQEQSSANKNASDTDTTIKGAADIMAQQAVQANRAVFSKPPDLPAERPVANLQRQFEIDWPILKRPPAIFDSVKSKLSNLKVPGLKRKKRSCMLKHSSNANYKKRSIDNRINGHTEKHYNLDESTADTMKISSKLASKIQQKCAQIDNDHEKTIKPEVQNANALSTTVSDKLQSDVANTTPRRMTLLERLAKIKNQDNKTKNLNESLSRMTLHSIANSDNDSDED